MAEQKKVEFFLLRYVPDTIKEEFINFGLVMHELGTNGSGFADVRFIPDWRRLRCLDPNANVDELESLQRDIRVNIADGSRRGKWLQTLTESCCNMVQISSPRVCRTDQPAEEIETLAKLYLEHEKGPGQHFISGRQGILVKMQEAWEQAGVWNFLLHGVPVSGYTKPGDPFVFDFGYAVRDEIKLFHAVSMKASVAPAIMVASRFPQIAASMMKVDDKLGPRLTAVVDGGLDLAADSIRFARDMMMEAQIEVVPVDEMPRLAELARQELRA